jgi:hypothetical protein
MKRKRYADEQIAFALRQAESDTSVEEICRKLGVSEPTFYCMDCSPCASVLWAGRDGQFAYLYPASRSCPRRPNGKSARAGLNRWPAYGWPR